MPMFDVTQYGAIGDGSTNDKAAIERAIAAAAAAAPSGGATVYFPAGNYCVEVDCINPQPDPPCIVPDFINLADYPGASPEGYRRSTVASTVSAFSLSSNLTVLGEGAASRIICTANRLDPPRSDVARAYLFAIAGAENITIRGLTMVSTGGLRDAFDDAIHASNNGSPARNLTIEDCIIQRFRGAAFSSTGLDLAGLRITGCDIRDIGRMHDDHPGRSHCVFYLEASNSAQPKELMRCAVQVNDHNCSPVFGVGVNANGWNGLLIARNYFQNIGSYNLNWAIYCVRSRSAVVSQNRIVDCSGGIAWTGITELQGEEDITVIGNSIDLAREVDADWVLGPDEERFNGSRIGLQLRGDNRTTPLQAHVVGNTLRWANIQCATQNAVIADNDVDLDRLANHPGIWVGWLGSDARNVVVSQNRVRAMPPESGVSMGILVSTGENIRIIANQVRGTTRGIALGIDYVTGASGIVSDALVSNNAITSIAGGAFISMNGADRIEVSRNDCLAAGRVAHGILIGDGNVPQINRDISVRHNRFYGGPGTAFGLTTNLGGTVLPRNVRIEENIADFQIVNWPPNCPPDSHQAVFKPGDILRGNVLSPPALLAANLEPECVRSVELHGAANGRRPLRAHEVGGERTYSVLGGQEFTAPLSTVCPWETELVLVHGSDPPDYREYCGRLGEDNASRIASLSDGFEGQEITIHAVGALTIVGAVAPDGGNIYLFAGATQRDLVAGNVMRLRLEAGAWLELTPP